MAKHRKVTIKNEHKIPMNKNALTKLVRYYYKGHNNISINFDNRISAWGMHHFNIVSKTHEILISPAWCSFEQKAFSNKNFSELTTTYELVWMKDFDIRCRVITTLLHELKHAAQCDKDFIGFCKKCNIEHPMIANTYLRYKLSLLETEAEAWALTHFNRALNKYERWCDDKPEP